MAYLGEGEWFNPFTQQIEMINGVWCECYECKRESSCNWSGPEADIFYTKKEYREHKQERRRAYFARLDLKRTKDGMARTKEITEAEAVWEGRPVPTFFDIKAGKWNSYEDPVHEFDRLFGSKPIYETSNRGL